MERTTPRLLALAALVGAAGLVQAQTIEFRFIERTGQSSIAIGGIDNVLSIAVQGRIVGAGPQGAIGGYVFDVVMPGEPDSFGTLTRERISNADHTLYFGAPAVNNTTGVGGIASQYSYLAGISASFNGVINFSSGTFTNTPGSQEIGNVTGACIGVAMLRTPGVDASNGDVLGSIPAENPCDEGSTPRADCNPDTWNALHTWNSSVTPPSAAPTAANGDTATIDPAIESVYFGTNGAWVDLYRFRYTATNATPRTITVTLARAGGQSMDHFVFGNGSWGAAAASVPVTVGTLTIPVGNPGACCDALGACAAGVDTGCAGTFIAGGACSPSPCTATGACCSGAQCTTGSSSACSGSGGQFHAGSACNAGINNPTTCCEANFDGVGGVEVKDIFDWLNAWFANDPRTDSNHNGVHELFDIFTFLQDWFVGCG